MPQAAYRPKNPFEVQDAVHMSPFDVDYRRRNSSFTSMQDQLKKQKGKATSYIQPFDIGTSAQTAAVPAPSNKAAAPVSSQNVSPKPVLNHIDPTRFNDPEYVTETVQKSAGTSKNSSRKVGKIMFIISLIICLIILLDSFSNGFSSYAFSDAVSKLITPLIFVFIGRALWKNKKKDKNLMTIK